MEKDSSEYEHQQTTHVGQDIEQLSTMQINPDNVDSKDEKKETKVKGKGKGKEFQTEQEGETSESKDYLTETVNQLLIENKNAYYDNLNQYKDNKRYKINPDLHLIGDEVEVENYIVNEKIYTTTYVQYIDVYESAVNVEEEVEEEEIEYVELPKYITKYKPKIIIENVEKTIEVPSGEEIKKPKYNNVDVPYIIPNLIENEILVVMKKVIQPEIEITNEVLEIEVEKYIPKLIPVNVYVPRYFGISAKFKGQSEETIRYIDLTEAQINSLMKELNPHLEELKLFNENQLKRMDEYIKESETQSKLYNFTPPQPLAVSYDELGNCKNFEYSEFNKIKHSYLNELIH